ncbi:hypothetical protein E1265_20320 [Streptomyces sp. 8K308]|uniref:hypothetical protein n=1 Tax=Streptomyces sp. 8K308 TaxID=2530388 RepID=UPI00104F5BA8|nr:hypothetical protein [Streptomyces sp. 8K308]TDC20799.1 hypothetical protein E1265_20320 [Streptomyces sp. 8K308]
MAPGPAGPPNRPRRRAADAAPPEATLGTWLVCGAALVVGVVSLAGIALVVPVLIALQHLHRHRSLGPTDH